MFCLNISGKWGTFIPYVFSLPRRGQRLWKSWQCHHCQLCRIWCPRSCQQPIMFLTGTLSAPITYSVFQWADPTPSCHTKHRPTNPQTIKFLSHFWVFGVFWQSFEKFAPRRNLAGKYQREDYYRDFCCKYCTGLFCWTCNPLALGDWLWIWWQLVVNIVLSWPTTHRNRCFLVSALTNPLRVN